LAATSIKNLLSDHWTKVSSETKLQLKEYCLHFLANKSLACEKGVLKMVLQLIAKICKLSWLDNLELKTLVDDILQLFTINSSEHILIGLYAIEQIILEMTYLYKGKTLTLNRRVSLNFRDSSLIQIFKNVLQLNKYFIELIQYQTQQNQQPPQIVFECLSLSLEICHKSLIFDYTSVLLNETMDEPSYTNIPNTWKDFLEEKQMVSILFLIMQENIPSPVSSVIKARAASCLSEIANVRQSVFTTPDTRIDFVKHFCESMIGLLQSNVKKQSILKDRNVFKEFVKIPYKFETNF